MVQPSAMAQPAGATVTVASLLQQAQAQQQLNAAATLMGLQMPQATTGEQRLWDLPGTRRRGSCLWVVVACG